MSLLHTVIVGRRRALEPSLLFARGYDEAMSGDKVSLLRTVVVGRRRALEPSLLFARGHDEAMSGD